MQWLILLCSFLYVRAQYNVPDAIVEPLSPRGFRVSIPDEEGIKLFAFHGKINEEMNGREAGTFSRDILKAKNGLWTFYDPTTKLKPGDIIYYWTYVEYFDGQNKLGYPKDDQMFEVKELIEGTATTATTTSTTSAPTTAQTVSPDASSACPHTDTTYHNGRKTCKGKALFSDSFSAVRDKYWTVEQKFASAPDYEFVLYVNRPETLFVDGRVLKFKPEPIEKIYGEGFVTTTFNLGENCTGVIGSPDCTLNPDAGFILPPVISSQINTKGKFSFKYGKIEIKAKLPTGDWIYPELYLNSVNDDYGLNYDSGQIRIAFTPGNVGLNKKLNGGIILGATSAARSYGMKTVETHKTWTHDFHRFGVIWKPGSITVSVDDKVYGTIYPPTDGFSSLGPFLNLKNAERWKSGTSFAPFDKEMYITLGVGVGGFNFEDQADGKKPWKNGARSSTKDFYKAQSQWASTWGDNSALAVDYVKVWAL